MTCSILSSFAVLAAFAAIGFGWAATWRFARLLGARIAGRAPSHPGIPGRQGAPADAEQRETALARQRRSALKSIGLSLTFMAVAAALALLRNGLCERMPH